MKVRDVVYKDLKLIFSDKKALVIMILMPIILSSILSMALSGSFTDYSIKKSLDIAIVKEYDKNMEIKRFKNNLSNGIFSKNISNEDINNMTTKVEDFNIENIFFNEFLENKEIKEIINYKVLKRSDAINKLKNKELIAVVILPKDFIFDMHTNILTPFRNKVDIKVIGDPDESIKSKIVESIMKGFSQQISTLVIGKNVFIETALNEGIGYEVFNDIETIISDMTSNIKSNNINLDYEKINGKKPISSFSYYAVAMATMFILFAAGYGSRTLLEEKENITYQRMVISGTSKFKILAGKYFTIFTLALIQIVTMVIFSSILLKANWGSFPLVMLISLCVVFAIAGLGILIAVITYKIGNYKVANVFESAIIQVMALLGGSFIPVEVMPEFIQNLGSFTINGLALKSYIKVMMGYGINEIFSSLLTLLIIGVIFIIISVTLLKREERWKYVKHNKVKTYETA
ncbi:MAG: ABC transporter permease [Firmicutes bacterium]|nr:ABC transporter permease [Bacillota bacterium]